MKKIRTLLVDDEQPARERLRELLAPYDEIEIVGEAEDGEQAVEMILDAGPDLVFLDIQMPACTGMEVAAALPSPRPKVVFCTAYDQYAVDAFELHAVDYLLKPVSRARLAQAIDRVRRLTGEEAESSLDRVVRSGGARPARFLAKRGTCYRVVLEAEVLYFGSEGGLTLLQTAKHRYWMQPSLADLEQRLGPGRFYRISRSAIVHLDAVREVAPVSGGVGEVLLRDGSRLEVSRRRFKELIDRLERA